MNSTALGVVAGVVVFAVGGLHGLLVLTVAIVSYWIVRSSCIWLLVQHNERATPRKLSALKTLVARRKFTIILALLLTALAAALAAHLGDFTGFDTGTARRASSPLAAFGWLLLVLAPLALVCWVFVQVRQQTQRRQAEEQERERERQEAAQRREAERKAEQERQAQERRRQAEEQHEFTGHQRQRDCAAKQFREDAWWTVLEVSPHANADEIRSAYHRKVKQCHPDRVAGLAPEFVELAVRQTRTLNAAYDEATRARRASQPA